MATDRALTKHVYTTIVIPLAATLPMGGLIFKLMTRSFIEELLKNRDDYETAVNILNVSRANGTIDINEWHICHDSLPHIQAINNQAFHTAIVDRDYIRADRVMKEDIDAKVAYLDLMRNNYSPEQNDLVKD
jgi:hypothetical protein